MTPEPAHSPLTRPSPSPSRRRLLSATAVLGGAALTGGLAAGRAAGRTTGRTTAADGPAVTRLGDTVLDPAAIYFVSFDGLVNNESFQLNGIVTHAGHQYTAWYTADRTALLARRRLPAGPWQTLRLPHRLSADDSHNVISLGISPADGRLHVAMDVHNTTIFYTKSIPGLVTRPATQAWTAAAFGPIQRTLDGIGLGGISYPQFLLTPEGRLQFSFRTGGSGNGTNELAEYAVGTGGAGGTAGTWTRLGKWSAAIGTFTHNGVTSGTRNMYIHGLTYGRGGRLHAAFTWREGNLGVLCDPGGLSNHDTGYVFSDDRGRTWRNGAGTVVGTTGGATLVSIDSPGHVIDPLDVDRALMNQESQAVDAAGRPHVIISYVPTAALPCVTSYAAQRTQLARTFHLHRDAAGAWHKTEIPVAPNATGRSRLVFDRRDNAYVVMPFGRIVAASARSGWTDWSSLFDAGGLNCFGEVVVDYPRVTSSGVLSVLYQEASTGTTPSPIHVIDFRLGG
jgi:BNR repeat-containing family member